MGTTNVSERPQKRRNVRQAKRADRLEPKGTRQGMGLRLLDHHGPNAVGEEDGSAPLGDSCGTG